MNGRGNFGVMRPTDNPYASMGKWNRADALDLSKYFQGQQPQENANGQTAGSAVSGIAGNVFNALMKKRKLGDIARSGTPIGHDAAGADGGLTNASHGLPMFARGGKLKKGINIVGENGPEIAIQGDDGTAIVPLTTNASVSSNVTNRPMQPVPQQPEQPMPPPDMSQLAQAPAPDATPYAPAGQAMTQAMMGQSQPNVADNTWSEIQRREGKQFDATPVLDAQGQPVIGPDGKPMTRPGKDNAKTHNWKDVLKSIGLGVLNGADKIGPNDNIGSTLGKLVGGAGFGAGYTALDRNADEKMGNDRALQKLYGDYQRQYGTQQQRAKDQADLDYRKKQADWYAARPDIEQKKLDNKVAIAQEVTKRLNERADIKAGQAKPIVNANGQIELQFLNVDSQGRRKPNELLIGADGNPVTVPGDQGVEWTDPYSGQTILLKGRQAATAGIQQAQNNQTNAYRQQQLAQVAQKLNWDKQKLDRVQAFQQQMQKDRQQYGEAQAASRARTALKKAGFSDAEIEQWMNPTQFLDNANGYTLNPDGYVLDSNP